MKILGHVLNTFVFVRHVLNTFVFPGSDASDELQNCHHIRLYEPDSPPGWYEVLPVTHILGRLSLLPDFGTRTIPYSMRNKKRRCFAMGSADSKEGAMDGSKLWYVNHWAMMWSRSKPSLFR